MLYGITPAQIKVTSLILILDYMFQVLVKGKYVKFDHDGTQQNLFLFKKKIIILFNILKVTFAVHRSVTMKIKNVLQNHL